MKAMVIRPPPLLCCQKGATFMLQGEPYPESRRLRVCARVHVCACAWQGQCVSDF